MPCCGFSAAGSTPFDHPRAAKLAAESAQLLCDLHGYAILPAANSRPLNARQTCRATAGCRPPAGLLLLCLQFRQDGDAAGVHRDIGYDRLRSAPSRASGSPRRATVCRRTRRLALTLPTKRPSRWRLPSNSPVGWRKCRRRIRPRAPHEKTRARQPAADRAEPAEPHRDDGSVSGGYRGGIAPIGSVGTGNTQ
jgi:hypothetical protein